MYVPPALLVQSLRTELSPLLREDKGEASMQQSVNAALTLLDVRERGGRAFTLGRFEKLKSVLEGLSTASHGDDAWQAEIARLLAETNAAITGAEQSDLDTQWSWVVKDFERAISLLISSPALSAQQRASLALSLAEWEVGDRRSLTDASSATGSAVDTSLKPEAFESYLRTRFDEPTLRLTDFRQLSGGFGKETFLIAVEGTALNGELVVRRDPLEATVDNDCHLVRNEYPVIRSAFAKGFPAPDALWVETDHPQLPGGDFMVMRRASGMTGGNVFGATEKLSDELVEVLAVAMARLHTLPPCTELGDLTDSIRSDSWGLSMQESIRRYVRNWLDLYLREVHNPSPTLIALYGWLLDNVPASDGPPVLLHGDIGFHNMLIDDGRLTALVDWEFAHVGDPAEDVGSVKNTSQNYSWDLFMHHYRAAGGPEISPERLHFFRIWQHVRNASASNLSMGKFSAGILTDLKLAYTGHFHFPLFLQAARDLLAAGPDGEVAGVGY